MKVSELIEELKQLPQDHIVVMSSDSEGNHYSMLDTNGVCYGNMKYRLVDCKTVCPSDGDIVAYPEVFPGATRWAFCEDDSGKPITVTTHGLRRLIRYACESRHAMMYLLLKDSSPEHAEDLYGERYKENITQLVNECTSIFCEGDLCMSRLFIDDNGSVIRHKDADIDKASIPAKEMDHA